MIDKFGKSLLTMFGIGYFKYAPGTASSFVTCLIFYILFLSNFSIINNKLYIISSLIFILIYSVIIIDKLSHLFKKKDANEIVVDEFIGQSIPLMFLIVQENFYVWIVITSKHISLLIYVLLSFILFRIFDILKPYPINLIDKKMKNGLGIMLDDILAGIYSLIAIIIIYQISGYGF